MRDSFLRLPEFESFFSHAFLQIQGYLGRVVKLLVKHDIELTALVIGVILHKATIKLVVMNRNFVLHCN